MLGLGAIVLSEAGRKALGSGLLDVSQPDQRGVPGILIAYAPEGVWFQDTKLERDNQIVLLKWEFVEAIVAGAPVMESSNDPRRIGFR